MTEAFGATAELTRHLIPSYEGLLQCTLEGVGWALMPTMTVGRMIERGELFELVPRKRLRLSLNWQSHSQWSRTLKTLSDIVADVARERLMRPEAVAAS